MARRRRRESPRSSASLASRPCRLSSARWWPVANRSGLEPFTMTEAGREAERLLVQALREVRQGADALPTVSAAEAVLRAEAGEVPGSECEVCSYPLSGHIGGKSCTQGASSPAT